MQHILHERCVYLINLEARIEAMRADPAMKEARELREGQAEAARIDHERLRHQIREMQEMVDRGTAELNWLDRCFDQIRTRIRRMERQLVSI
jgi:hypothetical protein